MLALEAAHHGFASTSILSSVTEFLGEESAPGNQKVKGKKRKSCGPPALSIPAA